MSLEHYLYCRKAYDNIIRDLEDIIYNYDCILDKTNNLSIEEELCKELGETFFLNNNKNYFISKLKYTKNLKNICSQRINKLCVHSFIEDMIDLTPDMSKNIVYCEICEYTKN